MDKDTKQSRALRGTQEPKVLDVFASTDELIEEYKRGVSFSPARHRLEGRLAVFEAWLEMISILPTQQGKTSRFQRGTIERYKTKLSEQINKIEAALK